MIHFFTIVLNGMPFIRWHYCQFARLSIPWRWTIIEGAAKPVHDTAWCKPIPPGVSTDGTHGYLLTLSEKDPRVKLIGKPLWDGKVQMVNTAVEQVNEPCILMEIDVDEFWTTEQLMGIYEMFKSQPSKTHAFYRCRFFPAYGVEIISNNTYGNRMSYEWIRTWRFTPGMRFRSHEPPVMMGGVQRPDSFKHDDTGRRGLVFEHYAYWFFHQVRFKEQYYGYRGAMQMWKNLKTCKSWPQKLRDFYPWVKDEALVDLVKSDLLIHRLV